MLIEEPTNVVSKLAIRLVGVNEEPSNQFLPFAVWVT